MCTAIHPPSQASSILPHPETCCKISTPLSSWLHFPIDSVELGVVGVELGVVGIELGVVGIKLGVVGIELGGVSVTL